MRRAIVTAAVSALALAAACTGTPEAPVVVGEESSTSPSASPSATKPANPTEPPEDFARQYVRANNTALTTGDAEQLRELSLPSCASCERNAKAIETFHANGGSYQGDPSWHVTELGAPKDKDPVVVSMYVEVKPVKIVAKKGASPKPDKGHLFLIDLTLGKEDGRWKVADLVINSG
jgi:hypothetical protein